MRAKLAVLVSGGGTTLQALLDACDAGQLNADIAIVVSSRPGVFALERARKHGIPTRVVARKSHGGDMQAYSQALLEAVQPYKPDLVLLAGFLSILTDPFMAVYEGRIMNTHPALVPAFYGKGCYGHHAHQAVLDYGVKVSGATIMFADQGVDTGPIILQESVPVYDDDTVETLAERVLQVEHRLYPQAAQLFIEGRLRIEGRKVRILARQEDESND